jgi:hypothetical protein
VARFRLLRTTVLAALAAAVALAASAQPGLDPAVDARVKRDLETIHQADANRKIAFLTYGTPQADLYMALQNFRDMRVKATLDAVQALFPVRAAMPKDQWKALVTPLAERPAQPLLAEEALKALPSVVPDEARRKPAEKALEQLADAAKDVEDYRRDARKRVFDLLEKETSTLENFVSVLAKYDDKQAKLDDRLAADTLALHQALTAAEWQELVRRISKPAGGGAA